jgi:hypothetical protein
MTNPDLQALKNAFLLTGTEGFSQMHSQDSREAYCALVTLFLVCYSMLSPEDRCQCCLALFPLLEDINTEVFEDGPDFVSFLKEKHAQRTQDGQDASSE